MSEAGELVFRQRLIAVMKALNAGDARDPTVQRVIASFGAQLLQQLAVRSWGELKTSASGEQFNQMLQIFRDESAKFAASGDRKAVLGVEALALSLVARDQTGQRDLTPGIRFLDDYIEDCVALVRASKSRAN